MSMLIRLAVALGINALALWVANGLFENVRIEGTESYVLGAVALGFANAVLKPILTILTLPLVLVTLGLFLLVINIAVVAFAEWIAPNFSIDGFWAYLGTVVVVWLVNWAGHTFVDRAVGR
jgi:putative membrane protein